MSLLAFIATWLVIGLIAGFLANLVLRGGHGIVFDILLGLIGAIVGGVIFGAILGFGNEPTSFIGHILVAFGGAVVVLVLARLVEGRRRVFR